MKYSPAALAITTRQMSVLMNAGVPLVEILNFSARGSPLGEAFDRLHAQVAAGATLSAAMRRQPEVFNDVYCGLVEAGEKTGLLGASLQRLADVTERQLRLRQRLVATLTYPAILSVVTLTCLFVFVTFVMPLLEPVFLGMGVELPFLTACLLQTRNLVVPLAFLLGTTIWLAHRRRAALVGRFPRVPFRIPLLGPVLQKMALAQFLFALSGMLETGLALVPALARASAASGNAWISEQLRATATAIKEGLSLREAFLACGLFPKMVLQLVAAGEEAASLPEMIARSAQVCEQDCDSAMETMAHLLEPLLMLTMGLVVGFIVVAGMLPTLQLMNSL